MVPESKLEPRLSLQSRGDPSSVGTVPEILLSPASRTYSLPELKTEPSCVGSVPLSVFPFRLISEADVSPPISVGIVPVRFLGPMETVVTRLSSTLHVTDCQAHGLVLLVSHRVKEHGDEQLHPGPFAAV